MTINSFILNNIEGDVEFSKLVNILKNDLSLIKENFVKESILESNEKLGKFESDIRTKINNIDKQILLLNNELIKLNDINQNFRNNFNQNKGINILLGKIKFYLLNHNESESSNNLNHLLLNSHIQLKTLINQASDFQDPTDLLDSIIFRISSKITEYLKDLSYEHSENPTRFDLKTLNLYSTDELGNLLSMTKVGSGANYLALHIATLLSFHYHFYKLECSIPSFIMLDQPTQVFFPPILSFEDIKGNLTDYNNNVDVKEVIKLFKFLIRFTQTEVPDFQIIVTEHAYINEKWFKDLMPEEQWIPPLALIPESWPSL